MTDLWITWMTLTGVAIIVGERDIQTGVTVDIRFASPADGEGVIRLLTGLINEVYAASEEGLWLDGAARTTPEELTEFVRAGQIAVARLDGDVVGCVRVQRLDEATSEFGMLAAAPRHRGVGVGRDLVRYAERCARKSGSRVMQLELLRPREWTHPAKEFLAGWYGRMGYRVVRTDTVEASFPDLSPLLATPCDFAVYQKAL